MSGPEPTPEDGNQPTDPVPPGQTPPAPGFQPPGAPQPPPQPPHQLPQQPLPGSYGQAAYPAGAQPTPQYSHFGALGAAHKPGAVPLRPLGLSDLYDGAFRIIRKNPGATVGASVIVTSIAMLIPLALAAAATALYGDIPVMEPVILDPETPPTEEVFTDLFTGQLIANGGAAVGAFVQAIGLMLVTGMIVHVVAKAVLGHQLTLGQAWAATAGRRWRLVGLSVALMLFFLVLLTLYVGAIVGLWFATESPAAVGLSLISLPFLLALIFWLWIRIYYVAVPPLMLEKTTMMGAIKRNYALTRGHFWRTFGIALLTLLVTGIASGMLTFPLTIASTALLVSSDGSMSILIYTLLQSITTIVSAAFVTPFTSAVASLQYVDLRMRKEAFDVQLMAAANAQTSGAPPQ